MGIPDHLTCLLRNLYAGQEATVGTGHGITDWFQIGKHKNEYCNLFKKIRDTKGTFHAKMGTIKDRNGTDLTESEDIKKRWQEYTEELYKTVLVTWITMMA